MMQVPRPLRTDANRGYIRRHWQMGFRVTTIVVTDYVLLTIFSKFLYLFCPIITSPARIGQTVEQPKGSQQNLVSDHHGHLVCSFRISVKRQFWQPQDAWGATYWQSWWVMRAEWRWRGWQWHGDWSWKPIFVRKNLLFVDPGTLSLGPPDMTSTK